MSRKGKNPIPVPKGVEVKIQSDQISVKGPKGFLQQAIISGVVVENIGDALTVVVEPALAGRLPGAQGLFWSLINNMVAGTTDGFSKSLDLVGVGYRASVQGKFLDLLLGFSHPTKIQIPEGISVSVQKNTNILVSGADKQLVGKFAADVRAFRPPEPYKGKGVRYTDEYVRRKAGKSGKK
jgi:large subunit ribosomal protein L6